MSEPRQYGGHGWSDMGEHNAVPMTPSDADTPLTAWKVLGDVLREASKELRDLPYGITDDPGIVLEKLAARGYFLATLDATRAAPGLREVLEELAVDLVRDHRGIPYDVIERIDEIAALSQPDATAGIDAERLARAMTVVYEQDLFPIKSGDWRYDASLIAAEYVRLTQAASDD